MNPDRSNKLNTFFSYNHAGKAIGNSSWLLADKLIKIAGEILIGIWLARYLGAESFGMLSYALSFATIYVVVSGLGMEKLLIREFVSFPQKADIIWSTGLRIKITASLIALLLAAGINTIISPLSTEVFYITFIILIGSFFRFSDIVKYRFESLISSKFAIIAEDIVYIIMSIVRVWLIINQRSLFEFSITYAAEFFLTSISLFLVYKIKNLSSSFIKYDKSIAFGLLKSSFPLIFASISVILYQRIDILMLNLIYSSKEAGIYTAATKLSEVWYIIPAIILPSIAPLILKLRNDNPKLYTLRFKQLYSAMIAISVILAISVTLISKPLTELIFGKAYSGSAPILDIHIWAAIPVFLGTASSNFLIFEDLTKISFYRTFLGLILNILLNFIFIPIYGGIGAAIATLISNIFATFSMILFKESRDHTIMMLKCFNFTNWYKLIRDSK